MFSFTTIAIFLLYFAQSKIQTQSCEDPTPYFGRYLDFPDLHNIKCPNRKRGVDLAAIFTLCPDYGNSTRQWVKGQSVSDLVLSDDQLVPIARFSGQKYKGSPAIFLASLWDGILVSCFVRIYGSKMNYSFFRF